MYYSNKKEMNQACTICRDLCGNTKSYGMVDQSCEVSNCSSCLDKDKTIIIQNDRMLKLLGALSDYLIQKEKETLR